MKAPMAAKRKTSSEPPGAPASPVEHKLKANDYSLGSPELAEPGLNDLEFIAMMLQAHYHFQRIYGDKFKNRKWSTTSSRKSNATGPQSVRTWPSAWRRSLGQRKK